MFSQAHDPARLISTGALLLVLLGSLWVPGVAALPDDREQPIRISADHALRNEKEGVTVYSGNVTMEQGSLHILADRITIYRIIDEADKIVAKGQPAELQQQPEAEKSPVQASAEIIEYYKAESRVHLRHNAQIVQDGSTVTGETIEYFIDKQMVKAGSNRTREDSRVEVVIEASNLQDSEDKRGATDSE